MSSDAVSTITSVASALISVVAVVIAARSAASAGRSADAATSTLRRTAIRELVGLCNEIVEENLRMFDIATTLNSEYTALFALSGASGSSRETMLKTTLADEQRAADELSKEAVKLADDLDKLHNASNDDIDKMTTRLTKMRSRLRSIRESVERQLNEVTRERQGRAK
jgi:hypothetical protein